jgi:hypothetical protein
LRLISDCSLRAPGVAGSADLRSASALAAPRKFTGTQRSQTGSGPRSGPRPGSPASRSFCPTPRQPRGKAGPGLQKPRLSGRPSWSESDARRWCRPVQCRSYLKLPGIISAADPLLAALSRAGIPRFGTLGYVALRRPDT